MTSVDNLYKGTGAIRAIAAALVALTLSLNPATAQSPYELLESEAIERDSRIEALESRIADLEEAINDEPAPDEALFPASQSVADLCTDPVNPVQVAPGELDAALAAVDQSSPATTLVLESGATYPHAGPQGENLVSAADLTICGNGAVLEPADPDTNVTKGLITTRWKSDGELATGTLRIYDLTFQGARNTDRNGSGIRIQGSQNVECHRCTFRDMDSGILTGGNSHTWVTDALFSGLGTDGFSHGIYANAGASLTVERSRFENTFRGMHVKSLVDRTIVRDSVFVDLTADGECGPDRCASRQIEVTRGGDVLIEGNTFDKAPEAENLDVIYYGLDRGGVEGKVVVRDNVVNNARESARFIRNRTCSIVQADSNNLAGFGDPPEYGGGLISVNGADAAERLAGRDDYILGTDDDDTLTDEIPDSEYFVLNETMYGFAGNDQITSHTGRASMYGCDGNDHLIAGRGSKYISGGAGDDIIEVVDLNSAVTASCGPGHDVFRPGGPYTPDENGFMNRQWGKDRWAVKVVGGYRHILAECEVIEFSDGTVFEIEIVVP